MIEKAKAKSEYPKKDFTHCPSEGQHYAENRRRRDTHKREQKIHGQHAAGASQRSFHHTVAKLSPMASSLAGLSAAVEPKNCVLRQAMKLFGQHLYSIQAPISRFRIPLPLQLQSTAG